VYVNIKVFLSQDQIHSLAILLGKPADQIPQIQFEEIIRQQINKDLAAIDTLAKLKEASTLSSEETSALSMAAVSIPEGSPDSAWSEHVWEGPDG